MRCTWLLMLEPSKTHLTETIYLNPFRNLDEILHLGLSWRQENKECGFPVLVEERRVDGPQMVLPSESYNYEDVRSVEG